MTDIKEHQIVARRIIECASELTTLIHKANKMGLSIYLDNAQGYSVSNGSEIKVVARRGMDFGLEDGPKLA